MFYYTPIGPVPTNYPHLMALCDKARIVKHEETTKDREGVEQHHVWWSVLADPDPVEGKYGKVHTVKMHNSFCVILDYVKWLGEKHLPNLDATSWLDVALGLSDTLRSEDGNTYEVNRSLLNRKTVDLQDDMNYGGQSKYGTISQNAYGAKAPQKKVDDLIDW